MALHPSVLFRLGGCAAACLLCACATLAEPGGGDANLPNAGIGPFRALRPGELGNSRSAPNALYDKNKFPRDLSAIDLDGDPSTFEIAGYAAEGDEGSDPSAPPRVIARYGALDARSFDRSGKIVLEPALAWEGAYVAQPSVLAVNGETWMYYAAEGGIGLATSPDGLSFSRGDTPVLAPDGAGWEGGAVPASPSVLKLPDGSFRMFYAIESAGVSAIGEARSSDGRAWERLFSAPVLEPSAEYDKAFVGSPCAVLFESREGETILLLYYGAVDAEGHATIGLSARFGTDGPFERALSPVFGAGTSRAPREPSVLVYKEFSMLFATQKQATGALELAVAAAVAPGVARMPAPNPL